MRALVCAPVKPAFAAAVAFIHSLGDSVTLFVTASQSVFNRNAFSSVQQIVRKVPHLNGTRRKFPEI